MKSILKSAGKGIITPEYVKKNHWDVVKQLGKQHRRGNILDVLELEGSYALENSAEIFGAVSAGDKLVVCFCEDAPNPDMLTVKTQSGLTVGFLPATVSLLPRFLLSKGCAVCCYIEYKDYTNELLTIIVSMYVENY